MAARKNLLQTNNRLNGPTRLVDFTASDSADSDPIVDGLMVATTGNYEVVAVDDTAAIGIYLVAGVMYWIPTRRVLVTGSIATAGIVGLIV